MHNNTGSQRQSLIGRQYSFGILLGERPLHYRNQPYKFWSVKCRSWHEAEHHSIKFDA